VKTIKFRTERNNMWLFKINEEQNYDVGFYDPNGRFIVENVYNYQDAGDRVHFLNGGNFISRSVLNKEIIYNAKKWGHIS
jgi:hypothetical protein